MTKRPNLLDVYGRVSRIGDERQRSTVGQAQDCIARVQEHGAELGEVLIDEGRSAWRATVRRPAWELLMTRLESGATGGVVVFDLARFSRRPIEGERLIALAESGLVVLDSEGEYDLTSASGKKAFRDQLSAAAYESDRLSTRVRRGKKLKAERGESNRGNRPYGYTMDWQIVPEEAAIVREVVARLLNGAPINEITRDLNSREVPTRGGTHWTNPGIRQIVVRPTNAALASYRGRITGEMQGVEPIIPRDTWERIAAMFAARRRGRPPSKLYLLSGIVACGCGTTLNGIPKPSYRRYPDGSVVRHYYCHLRDGVHGGCGKTSIDMRDTDAVVRVLVATFLADPRHSAAILAAEQQTAEDVRTFDGEIREAEELAEELANRLGRGEITLARHDAAVGPLDRRLAELRRQRDEAVAGRSVQDTYPGAVRSFDEWLSEWDGAPTHTRRVLIRQALHGRRLVIGPPIDGRLRSDPTGRITIEE